MVTNHNGHGGNNWNSNPLYSSLIQRLIDELINCTCSEQNIVSVWGLWSRRQQRPYGIQADTRAQRTRSVRSPQLVKYTSRISSRHLLVGTVGFQPFARTEATSRRGSIDCTATTQEKTQVLCNSHRLAWTWGRKVLEVRRSKTNTNTAGVKTPTLNCTADMRPRHRSPLVDDRNVEHKRLVLLAANTTLVSCKGAWRNKCICKPHMYSQSTAGHSGSGVCKHQLWWVLESLLFTFATFALVWENPCFDLTENFPLMSRPFMDLHDPQGFTAPCYWRTHDRVNKHRTEKKGPKEPWYQIY